MIVAMTGATGFVGGHTLRRLVEAGHQVRALTRKPQPSEPDVTWIDGALDRLESLARLVEGADTIVHIAGVVSAPDAAGFELGNRTGTENMLAAAQAQNIARFIHISSLAAREPQLSLYGASKRAAEDAVTASSLDWTVLRPPAIYGPGDTELLDLFRMAKRGLVPLPPGGRLSVIHVDDLARLIVTLVESAPTKAIFEADDGVTGAWTHRNFARAIGNAVGRRVVALPTPKPALRLASGIERVVRGKDAKLTADRIEYFCHPDWTVDPAKRPPSELWLPEIETREGLAATAQSYRAAGLL